MTRIILRLLVGVIDTKKAKERLFSNHHRMQTYLEHPITAYLDIDALWHNQAYRRHPPWHDGAELEREQGLDYLPTLCCGVHLHIRQEDSGWRAAGDCENIIDGASDNVASQHTKR